MKTQQILLTMSVTAAVLLLRQRFCTSAGALPAAGAKVLGVVDSEADAGLQAPVNAVGSILVESGGAIAIDADVETDALGRAITRTTGSICGRAMDAAAGAGEYIRILRGVPG
jgi:hypothetical protein